MKNILTLGSRIDWCIKDHSTPDIKRLLQKVAIHRISLVYVYSTGADGSCPTIHISVIQFTDLGLPVLVPSVNQIQKFSNRLSKMRPISSIWILRSSLKISFYTTYCYTYSYNLQYITCKFTSLSVYFSACVIMLK